MRPTTTTPRSLSARVRQFRTLESAWEHVRSNAVKSKSPPTRNEVRQFELTATTSLRSIQGRLAKRKFVFKPARGIAVRKSKSNKKRPLVIAPIESRIVQRAILEVVQSIPIIHDELHSRFNFGGVDGDGFGVPGAITKAVNCAQQGGYFVRTDIKAFFTAVQRIPAVDAICEHFEGDEDLKSLFRAAAHTELEDAASLGDDVRLFPLADEGVAQGSCLSPFICNYLLRNFDRKMNDRGVTCIRYIDDFIMFAKNERTAKTAFQAALVQLRELGLSAYDPFDPKDRAKAEHGKANAGFTFLGCDIKPSLVRPTRVKCHELLESIKDTFNEAIAALADPLSAIKSRDQITTYSGAILYASRVIKAWGNTYSFCSDDRLMGTLDGQIDALLADFKVRYSKRAQKLNRIDRRRAIGLFSLADCNRDDQVDSARMIALSSA